MTRSVLPLHRVLRRESLWKAQRSPRAHVNRDSPEALASLAPFLLAHATSGTHGHVDLGGQPRDPGFSAQQSSGFAARPFRREGQHASRLQHFQRAPQGFVVHLVARNVNGLPYIRDEPMEKTVLL